MANLVGQERSQYVRSMFARIAPRYDLMNRVMTVGQDVRWRRFAVKQAGLPIEGALLDIATGTGEIAAEALRQVDGLTAVGGDFTPEMMIAGREIADRTGILWTTADTLQLPFSGRLFDAVTSGFLMRNVIDVKRALNEQARVLKPGGRLVILESSPPKKNILRPLILFHLNRVIPFVGRVVAGDGEAYSYLPESTQQFLGPDELSERMRLAGLEQVDYRLFMFGTIAVHWGTKPK